MNGVAVITGGTAGVGRATVRELARAGYAIAVLARGKERLENTVKEVEATGQRALGLCVDVTDNAAVERAARQIEHELGPINVWINNAFAGLFSNFLDITPEEYDRINAVTYMGQVNGTRAALKRMLPRDQGTVVLVGSALAHRGIPLQSAYCGAKHALQGFLDSLRAELIHAQSRVHITMVQLPALNTPQFDWARTHIKGNPRPVGKIYQPEVAARAIRFAVHARRKEIWVGGTTVQAILADKLASPLLDRYLALTAVSAQSSPEPVSASRQNNLFDAPPGDPGAHGRFDEEAAERSLQMSLTRVRTPLIGLALLASAGVLAAAGGWLKAFIPQRRATRQ